MGTLLAILDWAVRGVGSVHGGPSPAASLILLSGGLLRRREPSDVEVRRAAERYRHWYGDRALPVIGDHMLGARFAPDGRHSRFLKRVVVSELQAGTDDRQRVTDPWGAGRRRRSMTQNSGIRNGGALVRATSASDRDGG